MAFSINESVTIKIVVKSQVTEYIKNLRISVISSAQFLINMSVIMKIKLIHLVMFVA